MSSKVAKHVVSVAEWEQQLDTAGAAALNKRLTHDLVMEYLLREGYQDVAQAFAKEADTPLPITGVPIPTERMVIRKALQSGDIAGGIERLNDLDPEVLERDSRLFYHLQQQKLLEMIRDGQWAQALLFAQQSLAPRAASDPTFLAEMEKIMALSLLPAMAISSSASASGTPMQLSGATDPAAALAHELLGTSHRLLIADEVNDALLASHSAIPMSSASLSASTASAAGSAGSSATATAATTATVMPIGTAESRLVCALRRLLFEQRRAPQLLPSTAVPTIQPQNLLTATLTPAHNPTTAPVQSVPPTPLMSPAVAPLPSPSPPLPSASPAIGASGSAAGAVPSALVLSAAQPISIAMQPLGGGGAGGAAPMQTQALPPPPPAMAAAARNAAASAAATAELAASNAALARIASALSTIHRMDEKDS